MLIITAMCVALVAVTAGALWIPARPTHHPCEAHLMDRSLWPAGYPHDAPEQPLTVRDAHLTMQRHRDCPADGCPRKLAAYRALVAAGRITPANPLTTKGVTR